MQKGPEWKDLKNIIFFKICRNKCLKNDLLIKHSWNVFYCGSSQLLFENAFHIIYENGSLFRPQFSVKSGAKRMPATFPSNRQLSIKLHTHNDAEGESGVPLRRQESSMNALKLGAAVFVYAMAQASCRKKWGFTPKPKFRLTQKKLSDAKMVVQRRVRNLEPFGAKIEGTSLSDIL